MLFWIFVALAVLAFSGFAFNTARRNGHGMAYAFFLLCVWTALAVYTGGYL